MDKQPAGKEPQDPKAKIDEIDEVPTKSRTDASTRVGRDPGDEIDSAGDQSIGSEERVDPLSTLDPLQSYDPEKPDLIATIDPSTKRIEATQVEKSALSEQDLTRINEVCEDFESAWVRGDQEPDIKEFVPDDFDPGLRDTLVFQLLLLDIDYRKRKRKSLQPTEYLSRLPDCQKAVDSAFSKQESAIPRGYGSVTVAAGKPKKRPAHADDPSTRYPPTRFHAQGGLGAVFYARDTELNRLVALKEILPSFAWDKRVQAKFIFEAEVTGSLEHPGIVPVYGLGRYEDKQPYFAMRFIRGKSFRRVIEEFHKKNSPATSGIYQTRDFRMLLRRLMDVCNAMHYAHEHGVLHRDIKPDNIMIGHYGETLVVDWGLAKRVQLNEGDQDAVIARAKKSGSGKNTSAGSAVGTPMYMSPEGASGKNDQLDARTDVYSLGVVLFNIVTGDHPIEGTTARDVLSKVQEGETRSADSVVASAPKALASICRKAMAFDPQDRYQTAVKLADDIDRWMNDELVHAHIGRESITERAGRLIRRYRNWTVSGAAALLAITIVAVAAALLISNAWRQETIAKAEAREFKKDAVARYRDSRDAIDKWLVQSSDAMEFFPGMQSERARMLEMATADYEKLAGRVSRDPELELERGRALVRLGDLRQMQQQLDQARSHYQDAIGLFANHEGTADQQLLVHFRAEHGNAHARLGLAFAAEDQNDEAMRQYRNAIKELAQLTSETDDPLARRLLAAAKVNAGELFLRLGDSKAAIEHLGGASRLYEQLGSGSDPKISLGAARAHELLGRIHTRIGQHEEALVQFESAIDGLLAWVADQPDHPDYLDALASAYVSEASSFRARGLESQLMDALTSAVGHYRALRIAMPDVPRYTENLAITLTDLGLALHESGLNKRATTVLAEAEDLLAVLSDSYGLVPRFREELAACQDALGQVLLESSDDPAAATSILARSLATYQQLVAGGDQRPEIFQRLAIVQSHYAQSLDRQGDTASAEDHFRGAISTLEQLIEIEGNIPRYSDAAAHIQYRLAIMLLRRGDSQASERFQKARDIWIKIVDRPASYTHQLAWLLATCPDASIRDHDASLRYAAEAVQLAPENATFVTTRALAALLAGHRDEAQQWLDESESLRGHRIDRDFLVLAMAESLAGKKDEATRSFESGSTWMQQNRPHNAEMVILLRMAEEAMSKQEK